jgi:hypothetical protein
VQGERSLPRVIDRRYGLLALERAQCPDRATAWGMQRGRAAAPLPRWFCTTKHILRPAVVGGALLVLLPDPLAVVRLHREDQIGTGNKLFGQRARSLGIRASGQHVEAAEVLEEVFGSWASQLVGGADKENAHDELIAFDTRKWNPCSRREHLSEVRILAIDQVKSVMGLDEIKTTAYDGDPREMVGRYVNNIHNVPELVVMRKVNWDYVDWLVENGAMSLEKVIPAIQLENPSKPLADVLSTFLHEGCDLRDEMGLPQPPWLIP